MRYLIFAALLLVSMRVHAEPIALGGVTIVAEPNQPSYVQYGIEELTSYLGDISGVEVPVRATIEGKPKAVIAVGPGAAAQLLGKPLSTDGLGEEGYILQSSTIADANVIIVAGATPRGTKAALGALMKRIGVNGKTPTIASPLDIRFKPTFATRGMHFNGWPFGYPYAFRSWQEKDWQRYLDILAYQGVNLFYYWPFMEIMPLPLSTEDQEYLAECRRVVDYAQKKHGMEVWIMHCTNRVAQDNCGVADPRKRPYWRPSQQDLNPGDPAHFQRIMDARAALYQAINNADGFCNIDSDPGYYVGSPLSDYVDVLKGCRQLLDRHTQKGTNTKLVDWMWIGWGIKHIPHQRNPEHQSLTIQTLKKELSEPWSLVSGSMLYLKPCRDNEVLNKTILLQYGMIEAEPAYPHTNVDIAAMRAVMDEHFATNTDMPGVMGNMQTPLLQFPHMFYFTSCACDLDYRNTSEKDVLLDVAALLYPDHRELIADCYLGLKDPDAEHVAALASKLEKLIQKKQLGRVGLFGRKVFPDGQLVAQSLVMQLKLKASTEQLMRVSAATDPADCTARITNCLDDALAWGIANGWPEFWGRRKPPLEAIAADPHFKELPLKIADSLKTKAAGDQCFADVMQTLSAKYDPQIVRDRGWQRLNENVSATILKRQSGDGGNGS